MSARAWQRRREGKQLRIALKRGFAALKADPDSVYPLTEYGLVMIHPSYYDALMEAFQAVERLVDDDDD